jgi:hypothetical protein
MKQSEMAQLLAVIAAAYPKFPPVTELTVSVWYEMFKDTDYKVANVAVKKIMLESTFAPSIAELRKAIVDITTPAAEKVDYAQAWGEVTYAIRYFGYNREDEAIASMSPRTAKVVRMIGWQNICATEEIDVLRGQFRMMYETTDARERQDRLIPDSMKALIASITDKSKYLTAGAEAAVTKE